MTRFSIAYAIMMLPMVANALSTGKASVERRQMFGVLGSLVTGAAVITAVPMEAEAVPRMKVGPASPFTGFYDDPGHPGCLRQVKVVGAPLKADGTRPTNPVMEVVGYDGNGTDKVCTERPTRADLWKIQGKMKTNDEVMIDFSPKGGPANLLGKWDGDGIVFPDGNKWTKIAYGANGKDRLPKDMSTLKSE